NKIKENSIYINFDDIRMADFDTDNFLDIEDIASEIFGSKAKVIYFLDEMQNIKLWEKWVNNLYSKDIKVFVTGSNSSLLSSEISTYLTGRNKVVDLYPFSFKEFLILRGVKTEYQTTSEKQYLISLFQEYFKKGGFPLILKNNDLELSKQYFEDILYKDIISRYDIRKTKEYKDLVLYLFSNVGSTYSYSTLKQVSGIKSLSMIKNYIDYLKNVFLGFTINKFDYSIKKQKVSSSKFYAGDNSFLKTVAFNFSENAGHRLENLVFINLLRKGKELYYHHEKTECDFVIKQGLKIIEVIQVSLNLSNPKTKNREIEGLMEAMNKYKLKKGLILTLEEEDEINLKSKKIIVKPVWKWMLN
ncbi:MAG TPA: ATP-binding protein, partial [Candidatus Pacearchaeota archaeon]|nr:ATP-binding protein [Candidatus Pacearchaeota archaeon]